MSAETDRYDKVVRNERAGTTAREVLNKVKGMMKMPILKPNLKPCPFCGTNDALNPTEGTTFRWVRIECGCGAVGPEARRDTMSTKDAAEDFRRAAKEWNERKP